MGQIVASGGEGARRAPAALRRFLTVCPGGQGHRTCEEVVLKPLGLTGYLHEDLYSSKHVGEGVQS